MIKGIWSVDKYTTFKSCAAVAILGAVVAAGFLIIRVLGEKRLERFLKFILCFGDKKADPSTTAEVFVSNNRI